MTTSIKVMLEIPLLREFQLQLTSVPVERPMSSFGKCVCVCVSGRWVQSLQWHECPLNHESTIPHLGGMKLHLHCQKCCLKHPETIKDNKRISGQIIIFHQPRFPWNKGISLSQLPFGVRSCEVAIIWPGILNMCYKNAILTLTNGNHPWLGFMAKLHTQRGLRGFLLDEPPADWSNDKWKDHEASNGKNMSCNCFPGVLLLRHSLIGWHPWHLQIFGKTLWDVYTMYICREHMFWKITIFAVNHSPIELSPHLRSP